jgi:hypothetical protein
MRRAALVVLALLVAGPAAQAKAPPFGVDVCGASCIHLDSQTAERLPGIFWNSASPIAPVAPAPFYVLRWQWEEGGPTTTAYYVPSRSAVYDTTNGGVGWERLDAFTAQQAPSVFAPLPPAPEPTFARVTVGGRGVEDPASYARLYHAGRLVWPDPPVAKWVRVVAESTQPSPWTGRDADVEISARGGYLSIHSWVFKIPKRLAARARAGLSLR